MKTNTATILRRCDPDDSNDREKNTAQIAAVSWQPRPTEPDRLVERGAEVVRVGVGGRAALLAVRTVAAT